MKKLILFALVVALSAWAVPAMSGGTKINNRDKEREIAAENARRADESRARIERMEAETRAINEGRAVIHDESDPGDSNGNYDNGSCLGDCGSEHGICMGGCNGNTYCITRCAEAHGRCTARCNR